MAAASLHDLVLVGINHLALRLGLDGLRHAEQRLGREQIIMVKHRYPFAGDNLERRV